MKPSLYAQYLAEREYKNVIETDDFFAAYEMSKDAIYISDVFVVKEKRKLGVGKKITEELCAMAKEKGAKLCVTSACASANGFEESLLAILHCGFKFSHFEQGSRMMYFKKEL